VWIIKENKQYSFSEAENREWLHSVEQVAGCWQVSCVNVEVQGGYFKHCLWRNSVKTTQHDFLAVVNLSNFCMFRWISCPVLWKYKWTAFR